MITAKEALELGKKMRHLTMELMKAAANSGVDEVQGVLVYLANTNEALAKENEGLRKRVAELEDAAGIRD